jgi:hypothetical protein
MRLAAWSFALTLGMVTGAGRASAQVQSFQMSYAALSEATGTCTAAVDNRIDGYEPADPGTYPVFAYVSGTLVDHWRPDMDELVERAAAAGFVAASIEWPNQNIMTCPKMTARAGCMFDETSASSALEVLCSRPKADCGKGIVVHGVSQGAGLAVLAANYSSDVRAAWAMAIGVRINGIALDCLKPANRALPVNRLRATTGERDNFFGNIATVVRSQQKDLTGYNCGTADECWDGQTGAGYDVVQGPELEDGYADHCFMRDNGCTEPPPNTPPSVYMDAGFWAGDLSHSLDNGITWLLSFTD